MGTPITRADLEQSFPSLTPKVRAAIEAIFPQLILLAQQSDASVAATEGINNATVLTLSANDAFGNERIIAHGSGVVFQDNGPGSTFIIALANDLHFNGPYRVAFNLLADTNLDLPASGRVLVDDDFAGGPYATDAAAAADGIAVGQIYRHTAGTVVWRQV